MAFDQVMSANHVDAGPNRTRRRRRRFLRATAASALIHVGFVLVVVWSATGASFSGGGGAAGGAGDAVWVSLVGPVGSIARPKSEAVNAQAAEMDALMHRIRAVTPEALDADQSRPKGDVGKLFDEIAKAHPAQTPAGEAGDSRQSQAAKGVQSQGKGVEGAATQRGDQGHAAGDVWGQIQTCWRPEAVVPVTLEVVIDNRGRLTQPPKILRPEKASLDESRLRAEASAVRAVASCAPFKGGPLFGTRTYRFAFAPRQQGAG